VGGDGTLLRRTGSRAFERFTGPQIRRFFKREPKAYAATSRIHLISSFLASVLSGADAPVDPGDAAGTNLMDLAARAWWPAALDATAPGLAGKLPRIAAPSAVVGALSAYWRERYGLPEARVVVWSGDNPSSLVGTGLIREGRIGVSLGTSDTVFGVMREPRVDGSRAASVFGAPTGDFMGLTCFMNGSLARERVRDSFGMGWSEFSAALRATPTGNGGAMMLPWFDPEITPHVGAPAVHRFDLPERDGPANVRAVVEAQMMSMANHSSWMGVDVHAIHATGGASRNPEILQVMADVFGADVYQLQSGNSACLGAALRAYHANQLASGVPVEWEDVVSGLAVPGAASRIQPVADRVQIYAEMRRRYAEREAAFLNG
jgi:xylulokinase